MTTLRDEMMVSYYLYDSGASLDIVRDDEGRVRLERAPDPAAQAAALGPGAYRDIYAISEAADAPVSEQEVAGTMGGVVPGVGIGAATGIQDVGALAYGGFKAATAEEGQRIDEFLKGFSAISGAIGSEKAFDLYNAGVDALPISDEAKQGLKQGAMVGEVIGGFGVAGQAGKGVVQGAKTYAAGAPQRIADRTSGTMFGAGMDPTAPIDEAIVAGQKLLKEGKGPTAENPVAVVPPTETEPGVIAFHGSGADFDQFSLEKIGTGEGGQAYGYGLYFTDSEDIAKFYRDTVGGKNTHRMKQFDDIGQALKGKMTLTTDIVNEIIDKKIKISSLPKDAQSSVKEILKRKEPPNSKSLYKVGLAPKPEDMIDYQTTFADQPQKVQDALKAIGYDTSRKFNVEETGNGRYSVISVDDKGQEARKDFAAEVAGKSAKQQAEEYAKKQTELAMRRPMPMVLDSLKGKIIGDVREGAQAPDRPDKILSEKLLEQGIPGIKYRAAGSRAANVDAADAEMNYVIFDDKAIKILEKYGIVGPVAVTAIAGAQQQEGNDNGA